MSLKLQRLDHVALTVRDRLRSIAWYRDVLGLTQTNESRDDDWPVFMGDFGCCIALFQGDGAAASVGSREGFHAAFTVARGDFDRAQDHLRAHGVSFVYVDHGSTHSIYFPDPDGYRLELTTYEVSVGPALPNASPTREPGLAALEQ